jgi:pimeloyl-ACP methyl ester carboxylesterase
MGLAILAPEHAAVDVFYVHPTSYLGSAWNGPVDDAKLNAQTDALATRIQASAFNGCCAVYGPRYRQAQGQAFIRASADGAAAIDLAYEDVRAAFRYFVAQHNRGRPFILAGHSQGSVLAARLLEREIAGTVLGERLVAAYLIGAPITAARAAGVPVCASPEATGCLVAWNARGPRFAGSVFDFHVTGERVCVNPLTWRSDEAPAAAELNQGAVFLDAGDGAPLPGFANAQCRGGMLIVSTMGDPPRGFMSRLLDFAMGPENHHPIEYQLFYMNLRRNAETRVAAYLRENGR